MNWFKKHWNDPITVGSYTKTCVWSGIISAINAMVYILYIGYAWFNWSEKITSAFKKLVHKNEKSFTEDEEEA